MRSHLFGGQLRQLSGINLAEKTSMGVGGNARCFYSPSSVSEMRDIYVALHRDGHDPFILGGGCNTIFPDDPFDRPIIHTERIRGFKVDRRHIRVEAGLRLESLIHIAHACGLAGLEKFRGVPGTVGGAIAMNAGGCGCEFGQLVHTVVAINPPTGEIVEVPAKSIRWSYRRGELGGLVVVGAELALVSGDTASLRQEAVEFHRWKTGEQPLGSRNSGCIFKNPTGHSAGWLIDRAGLKGKRVGSAVVSPQHANFIVNERGRARTCDVMKLIEIVRERVQECFDVDLELEVVLAADEAPPLAVVQQ